jgi:RHS repeat-associated protein
VNTLRYLREDHQGSVAAILNNDGTSYAKESFTAYGNRRSSWTWSGVPTSGNLTAINNVTRRGYTWHTALEAMGLNDMNGRIQDAVTGRFLSPDPYISSPGNTQSYNRYSYVLNNPLTLTDPSGFAQKSADQKQESADARNHFAEMRLAQRGWTLPLLQAMGEMETTTNSMRHSPFFSPSRAEQVGAHLIRRSVLRRWR